VALNTELSQLISLQHLDIEIKRLNHEIATVPERQQELERRFADSVREFLDLKQQLGDAENEKRRLEAELELEQQKHQKFKNDLMKATNEKEYTTAVREIDVARKAVGSLETEILKLMERIETLEKQVKQRSPEIDSRRIEIDEQLSRWSEAAVSDQQRLEHLRPQRIRLIEGLSPDARGNYERLSKMRSGFALAEARDYSCQACRMKIRPQVFNDIRRGETIITCESCGRILYFRAEEVTS